MRDLNQIITRNAARFIAEAIEKARAEGLELTQHMIAGRMANAMGMKQDSVRKQLERYLAGESPWQAHYIEGLASAVGKTAQELVSLDPASESVSELTTAQMLYGSLRKRLTRAEAKRVVSQIHQFLDRPALYDAQADLTEVMLRAKSKEEAIAGIFEALRRSTAWDGPQGSLRGRTKSPKKALTGLD